MKVLVCVKQVGNLADEVGFADGRRGIDPEYLDFVLNEWDWYATEEALHLREAHGGEVVVVTVGEERADAVLRRCLAMGADRAVRLARQVIDLPDSLSVACDLATVVRQEEPDLVLCGVQASDTVGAATGAALAGLLHWPVVTVVTELSIDASLGGATVRRELEGGRIEKVSVSLPAVLTVQTGINEPRYATFRAIKQAEQKPLAVVEAPAPGRPGASVEAVYLPERTQHAQMLSGTPHEVAVQIADLVKQKVG